MTPFGVWLRENAGPLLPLATYGTVWFERLGPLLAFSPIATGPIRTATVALFFAFHLALAAGLDIGIFPFAAMVSWLVFLPAWFWDVALRRSEPVAADAPTPLRVRWPVQLLVGAIFAWVAMSATAVSLGVANPSPRPVMAVADLLRLSQVWAMFAPDPPVIDTWIERIGETRSGERFDVDRGDRANWDRPERISALQSWNWRIWLGYFQGLAIDDPMRKLILDRLAVVSCRDWNAAHPEGQRFDKVYIVQFVERALPVGTLEPLKRLILLRKECAPL